MIEKNLESAILAQLRTALSGLGDSVRFAGSWQVSEIEGAEEIATVTVMVSPRAYDTYSIPYCNFSVSVEVMARTERLIADGVEIDDIVEPISDMLDRWQFDIERFAADATLSGEFVAAGVRLDGGMGPVVDRKSGNLYVTQNFTIRGHVVRGEP